MSDESAAQSGDVLAKLGAHPGLCAACRHRLLNETRRGTAYLRCGLAGTDATLPRYPRLPVLQCHGFAATEDQAPQGLDN
ncbi:hypothetical protein DN069_06960 [Streptacidiphilus pinicola]|uniref:Uncharacterized protein n=1 Tax=Streptacidiphilus pinicola TaxID=2219663 RepID=A0A2X0KHX4_9ACTN|nr:hypothetical protein [Streptacidiphilus pinicola]RAG86360.1 hypothetical protein DN069_06960 [Streptacidiphilus pinicola]